MVNIKIRLAFRPRCHTLNGKWDSIVLSSQIVCLGHVQAIKYLMFEYSRPQPFEDTDNNEPELTTDRSTVTKPSSLSPQPQPSGIRIVDERPTTFRAPAAQGGGYKYKILFCKFVN